VLFICDQEMRVKHYNLKQTLKKIRSFGTFYIAEQTPEHLKAIRAYELDVVLEMLPQKGRLLEIGAGAGWQTQDLDRRGYDVSAIDLPSSNYRENRVNSVTDYDGKRIPFEDNTFDIVFSSNVLEHIPHIYEFQKEIHRVLRPDGCALHVLPSSTWRIWSSFTELFRFWTLPTVHGEHAGNFLSEIYCFNSRWWARLFRETGWVVEAQKTNRLFYTGSSIMDSRLSMDARSKLSRVLGGACNIFVLRKTF
jgi:2-polyprenyl-3-methyl-5-hydroxy-6-metoxy-1,4-benzoquinol methylase